jgi:acetyltransferase
MTPDVHVRPLERGDEALLQQFIRRLSANTRRQRFQGGLAELTPAMLAQLTEGAASKARTLAAITLENGDELMIGEATYAPSLEVPGTSEIALVVADDWQRRGIGKALLLDLLREAAAAGIERVHADVQGDNAPMLRLARKLGFMVRPHPAGPTLARLERVLAAGALQAFRTRVEQLKIRVQTPIPKSGIGV